MKKAVIIAVVVLAFFGSYRYFMQSTTDPVEPVVLLVPTAALSTIYGWQPGTLEVRFTDQQVADRTVRIAYPAEAGNYPLILFSPGNWSDSAQYDALFAHWVSWGYVVVAANHLDSGGAVRGIFNAIRYGQLRLITSRSEDFAAVLAGLPQLEQSLPALRGKIDYQRIAAAGHSFGAFTAQQFIGAAAFDEDANEWHFARDPRIRAVVAISPPGPMLGLITEQSWQQVDQPMLVTTGTRDITEPFWDSWEAHRISFDKAVAGQNYALVVDGADHYFGNLICRLDREGPAQYDALNTVNATTTAFFDWHLKGIEAAQVSLESHVIGAITNNYAELYSR